MKLKTTCTHHIISGSTDDFSHDAAVAHALVQAIKSRIFHAKADELDVLNGIVDLASETMTGWGNPNTEYPQNSRIAGNGEVGGE